MLRHGYLRFRENFYPSASNCPPPINFCFTCYSYLLSNGLTGRVTFSGEDNAYFLVFLLLWGLLALDCNLFMLFCISIFLASSGFSFSRDLLILSASFFFMTALTYASETNFLVSNTLSKYLTC